MFDLHFNYYTLVSSERTISPSKKQQEPFSMPLAYRKCATHA